MKKAIFGGSFDPPHSGHLKIIQQAIISLNIDKLIVVPAFLNPFKVQNIAPAHLRLKWLKEMTEEMPLVEVSAFEIQHNRAVPTIETVEHFDDGDITYLIIGADNLETLSQWKAYSRLKQRVTFVVASRDAIEIPQDYIRLDVHEAISATQLRKRMDEAYLDQRVAKEIVNFYHCKSSHLDTDV